jgi:Hypothetical glycosyl hydrolase family 15
VRVPVLAALLGLVVVLGAPAGATSAGPLTSTPYAGFVRTAIDSNPTFPDVGRTARSNRFVILQSWKKELAQQLKAADPTVKVLAYKNLSFVSCDAYADETYVPQGVRCPDVNADHPEWFLTDSTGNRLSSSGYPWLWLLDVGNAAYQDAWAQGVIDEAVADGWDGVFMDDTNPTVRYHVDPARVARYPNDAAWRAATRSMLERVGPRIRTAGLLAIANVCCARDHGTVWNDWLPSLSGAMDEMFTKWGNDPGTGYVWDWGAGGWSGQLEEVKQAEAQGKYFLGIAHSRSTDARAATYGLATMLLATQGRSSFALAEDYTNETRFSVYDRALQLGAPAGAYFRAGAAYRRNFAAGTVVVNPSLASVTVALGAEYLTESGARVTAVTLGPTTGAVLLAAGGPGDDGPPPGDTTAPETTITSAPAGTVRSASASFAFAANEANARFQCRLDGSAFGTCTSPVTYTGLASGSHTFAVRAIDAAGNTDPSPATHSWRAKPPRGGTGFVFTSSFAQAQARHGRVRGVRVRVSGRVLARVSGRPVARVTLYRRTARGWRVLARVRTTAAGRFRVERRLWTSARSLRLRAVAASSGVTVRSRVVVVGVRVRQ